MAAYSMTRRCLWLLLLSINSRTVQQRGQLALDTVARRLGALAVAVDAEHEHHVYRDMLADETDPPTIVA